MAVRRSREPRRQPVPRSSHQALTAHRQYEKTRLGRRCARTGRRTRCRRDRRPCAPRGSPPIRHAKHLTAPLHRRRPPLRTRRQHGSQLRARPRPHPERQPGDVRARRVDQSDALHRPGDYPPHRHAHRPRRQPTRHHHVDRRRHHGRKRARQRNSNSTPRAPTT